MCHQCRPVPQQISKYTQNQNRYVKRMTNGNIASYQSKTCRKIRQLQTRSLLQSILKKITKVTLVCQQTMKRTHPNNKVMNVKCSFNNNNNYVFMLVSTEMLQCMCVDLPPRWLFPLQHPSKDHKIIITPSPSLSTYYP